MNKPTSKQLPEKVARHREAIITLAAEYGASNIRIFGSTLEGTADRESDIDLLVDLEPGRSLLDLGGLQMALQDLLNCRVDLKTPGFLRADIRERVESQAQPL